MEAGCKQAPAVSPGPLFEAPERTPRRQQALAVALFLVLSLVLWAHVWFGGNPAHAITCNCGDSVEQVWWLEWLPWAVLHGHNPFLSNAMWARLGGVNAMANTSWFTPAALLSPITLLWGPVASFNVANLLAPVLSGWAAFTLAGRFTQRWVARLLTGALFAFSPYILRNTVLGHIDLTLAAYLPLVLLLGIKLLTRGARPVRLGLALGALAILQFFTGMEVMALSVVTGLLCAAGACLVWPRTVAAARHVLLRAGAVAAGVAAAVLAYPVWYFLHGPRHVLGPFWPVPTASPASIAVAGPNVFSTHTSLRAVGYLGAQGPNTDFLGIGLLLLILLSSPLWARHRAARIVAVVGVACWGLEFVPPGVWAKLPYVASVSPVRFALPVSLCAGLLVAFSVDGWLAAAARWSAPQSWRRVFASGAVLVATVAAFIPLVGTLSLPFRVTTASVPPWFTHSAAHETTTPVILTVPFAYDLASAPMGWQAETNNSFDLVGGWAFIPGANGKNDEMISPLGGPVGAFRAVSRDPLAISVAAQESMRAAIEQWRPLTVIVIPHLARSDAIIVMAATLGRLPTWSGGVWVWHVGRETSLGPLVPIDHVRHCLAAVVPLASGGRFACGLADHSVA
jgi:hypothetical protein